MVEGHPFRDAPTRKLPSARIKSHDSRFSKFIGIGVIAVIWNVLGGWQFVSAVQLGPWSAIAFMSLIMLLGLVLLGTAVHAFLALFNPTVEMLASVDQPVIGDSFELRWRLTGKAARVVRLQIELEGLEEVTYTRGTDTLTEQHQFAKLEVVTTTEPGEIADGTAMIVLPRDAVASFTAKHNKIMWRLLVEGEIPNWPDIEEEFVLDVVGSRRARASVNVAA